MLAIGAVCKSSPPTATPTASTPATEPETAATLQGAAFTALPLMSKPRDVAVEPDKQIALAKWEEIMDSSSNADNPSVFYNEAYQNGHFLDWWHAETHPAGEGERYMAAFNSYELWLAGTPDEHSKGFGWSGYESGFRGFSGWYVDYRETGSHPNIEYSFFLNS